jgi:hypothetical protein
VKQCTSEKLAFPLRPEFRNINVIPAFQMYGQDHQGSKRESASYHEHREWVLFEWVMEASCIQTLKE